MRAVRRLAHRFLPAGDDDFGIAVEHRLVAERNRAQPRAAELVDAPGRTLDGNPSANGCLTGGILSLPGGQDLPQDHLGNLRSFHAGPAQRFLDRDLSQFVGRQGGKRTVERADRGAGRADDDDIVLHI